MSKIAAVIPARYASSRLPGKSLIDIGGKTLIQRVVEQVQQSRLIDKIIVATDDQRIYDHVESFGGLAVITPNFDTGTDRVAFVANQLDVSFVLNVQGDEPMIDPLALDQMAKVLVEGRTSIVTLCAKITEPKLLFDFNTVKVVRNKLDLAMYFSRQAIPAQRDLPFSDWLAETDYFQHLGVYGFEASVLSNITKLPKSRLEDVEKLEQLRWLEEGFSIACLQVEHAGIGIDTPQDLDRYAEILKSGI